MGGCFWKLHLLYNFVNIQVEYVSWFLTHMMLLLLRKITHCSSSDVASVFYWWADEEFWKATSVEKNEAIASGIDKTNDKHYGTWWNNLVNVTWTHKSRIYSLILMSRTVNFLFIFIFVFSNLSRQRWKELKGWKVLLPFCKDVVLLLEKSFWPQFLVFRS